MVNGEVIKKIEINHLSNIVNADLVLKNSSKVQQIKIPTRNMSQQKKCVKSLLYDLFGVVDTEKRYSWATTTPKEDDVYMGIIVNIDNLSETRSFVSRKLSFDFVCERQKLIVEYDERQHFTKQRKIALLSYSPDVHLYYNKEMWLKACDDINAKMKKKKDPFRDEKRAFYDSVRDIEAYRQGYKLIRIMHGQFDFSRDDAKEYLLELIGD